MEFYLTLIFAVYGGTNATTIPAPYSDFEICMAAGEDSVNNKSNGRPEMSFTCTPAQTAESRMAAKPVE